jgi:hypothetical protein
MEFSDYFQHFLLVLLGNAPSLIFWTVVIVFAVIMLRRAGGRAERFLVAGAGINILSNLLNILIGFVPLWLRSGGYDMDQAISITSYSGLLTTIIGMAGIICLLYAFWIKFQEKNSEGQAVLLQD